MIRLLSTISLVLLLASCGDTSTEPPTSEPEPPTNATIAGAYSGDFIVDGTESFSATVSLTLAADGKVTGTAQTTTPPVESGTVSGDILVNPDQLSIQLSATFPTAGTYVAEGGGTYESKAKLIGATLQGKDESGILIGSVALTLAKGGQGPR